MINFDDNFDSRKANHFFNIDWIKLSFVFPYKESYCSFLYQRIFNVFKLQESIYELSETGVRNFQTMRIYTPSTFMYIDPCKESQRRDGRDYFILELTGKGCREFENRGGSWFDLFQFINEFNNYVIVDDNIFKDENELKMFIPDDAEIVHTQVDCKRIDICLDVADNQYFNFDSLKRKIADVSYTCKFRSKKGMQNLDDSYLHKAHEIMCDTSINILDELESEQLSYVLKDNSKGYSIVFGRKGLIQLNIYDKKAEVYVKQDKELPFEEIIRYEMRFWDDHANTVLLQLQHVNNFKLFDKYGCSKLFSLLKIKSISLQAYINQGSDATNYSRSPNWKPYVDMLKSISDFDVESKHHLITPVSVPSTDPFGRAMNWLNSSVYNAISRVISFDQYEVLIRSLISDCLLKSLEKGFFTYKNLCVTNQAREELELDPLTMHDWLSIAQDKYVEYGGDRARFKLKFDDWLENYKMFFDFDSKLVRLKSDGKVK